MSQDDSAWREAGPEIIENWLKNGMGKIDNFRIIRSPDVEKRQFSRGRGKGKRPKPWER